MAMDTRIYLQAMERRARAMHKLVTQWALRREAPPVLLKILQALDELSAMNPRAAKVFELRYFGRMRPTSDCNDYRTV